MVAQSLTNGSICGMQIGVGPCLVSFEGGRCGFVLKWWWVRRRRGVSLDCPGSCRRGEKTMQRCNKGEARRSERRRGWGRQKGLGEKKIERNGLNRERQRSRTPERVSFPPQLLSSWDYRPPPPADNWSFDYVLVTPRLLGRHLGSLQPPSAGGPDRAIPASARSGAGSGDAGPGVQLVVSPSASLAAG